MPSSPSVDEQPPVGDQDGNQTESLSAGEEGPLAATPGPEPSVGMEFESEEAAKASYEAYAARIGFVMKEEGFRRSKGNGEIVWRRLACDREGFRRSRPKGKKPRITRERCKALIVVKKEVASGKWVVKELVKEHNHLLGAPASGVLPSQAPDEKDIMIKELTAELQRERKRSAAYLEQLQMILHHMEEHSGHLSRNIDDVVQTLKGIESNGTRC